MTKFQKRILKTAEKLDNCLIVGQGFGFLGECLEIFPTVFIVCDQQPNIRVKNLIYRDDDTNFAEISGITHILFDRNSVDKLEKYQHLWNKHNSKVIIEGDDPIGREYSKSLYDSHWQCTNTQGFFHVWERIK